jgi:hypothetical protein
MRYNATQNIETRLVLHKGRWTMKEHSRGSAGVDRMA